MKMMVSLLSMILFFTFSCTKDAMYSSRTFEITPDAVIQGRFETKAASPEKLVSTYRSDYKVPTKRAIDFKFSLNGNDNERYPGEDHHMTLVPEHGKMTSPVYIFGASDPRSADGNAGEIDQYLDQDVDLTLRVDMRQVLDDFKTKGYFVTKTGEKIISDDFKGVFVAGNTAPLSWDFASLAGTPKLQLKDPDDDGIYEVILHFAKFQEANNGDGNTRTWELSRDLSGMPVYHSQQLLVDALYNKAMEEMMQDIRDDGAFMAGAKWPGVWTRDISYSILLSLAAVQPEAARKSLLAKVKNDRIIQDTGTGGSWPVSTDRTTWALAAWEVYCVTGDEGWLRTAYRIIRNSARDDLETAFDAETGLFRGESSFLDWREQTYPRWMDPKDIYTSLNLGTNAVHYQTYRILEKMAGILGEDDAAFSRISRSLKEGINNRLWVREAGYYGQYLYGRNYLSLSPRAETLGEALCVLFGVADSSRSESIFQRMPLTEYGPTCIYPQIPNIPPYHNDAIWPFVAAYWTWSAARGGNSAAVEFGLASIYRAAALFLTNKENMVAHTGDFMGTEINSDRQLWSVAGNLSTVYRVFFGMSFEPDRLTFSPFVPASYTGTKTLTGFHYRNAILDITLEGHGNKIKAVLLDGKPVQEAVIPGDLAGKHTLMISLMDGRDRRDEIRLAEIIVAPETPHATLAGDRLRWEKIDGAVHYLVYKNGKPVAEERETEITILESDGLTEYQVAAVDSEGWESFLSEPVPIIPKKETLQVRTVQKNIRPVMAGGNEYLRLTKELNTRLELSFEIAEPGFYAVDAFYANGSGPINTNNRCAIRTLLLDGQKAGTLVLPQRGNDQWDDWGFSNSITVQLSAGKHVFTLAFLPQDRNMNADVNEAWLDHLRLRKLP